jgi:SseB protein N-terminal domain
MTELDQALETMRRDLSDTGNQSKFYQLFLSTPFFVPTLDEQALGGEVDEAGDDRVLPLVIEAEGNDYLLLFDTVERLHAWAEEEVKSVAVPGHVLAATTEPPLRWALNVGTDHAKQFLPEEIAWLRDVVERCNAEA